MRLEQEQHRLKGLATDLTDLLLCNFCECKSCATLQVDVVAKR